MTTGIRATVKFGSPDGCPVARHSRDEGSVIDRTATSVSLPGSKGSVTEFLVDTDDTDGEGVFCYGSATVRRVAHEGDVTCPCECLGQFGCPIHRYVADDGDLTLVFHAESFDQLQDVMAEFRDRFDDVDVQRLLQPPLEGTPEDRVFINRGKLTGRQLEVLETAFEMGYFERPKGANATEIAAELDISQSTFTEHLVIAQQKILQDLLG